MTMQQSPYSTCVLGDGWEADVYRDWAFPPHVLDAWNRLAREYGDAGIFLGPGWFETWWRAFGSPGQLRVFILTKGGCTHGIFPCRLPLASDHERNAGLSSLTNDHTCHYDFLVSRELAAKALQSFLAAIEMVCPNHQALFEYLPAHSSTTQQLGRTVSGRRTAFHVTQETWAPVLDLPRDWKAFVSSLPGRLRNSVKRCRRKAETQGRVEFEVVRHTEELDRCLTELFTIEAHNWKGEQGTAMKSDPIVERFYRALTRWAMEQKSLLLFFLRLDGRPLAGSLCLISGTTVYLLKPGYDDRYSSLSPGTLLQAEVLAHLAGMADVTQYNFLGACDRWKMEWTSQYSKVATVRVYPRSVHGWLTYGIQHGWKMPLKMLGKTFPLMNRTVQKKRHDDAT